MTRNTIRALLGISFGRALKSEIRISLILALLVLCCLSPSAAVGGATEDLPRAAVGISVQMYHDIDARDAAAAFKIWMAELADKTGFRCETVMYPDIHSLVEDFQKGRIDMASLSPLAFFKYETVLQSDPAVIGVRHGTASWRYVVLVSADRPYGSINSLKGLRLAITQNDDLAVLYLNTLLLREGHQEMDRFFSTVLNKPKPSQTINAVYFGAADVCVTTEQAFQIMTEMNPQVGRKLKIVSISPGLLQGVGIYRHSYPKDLRKRIEAVFRNFKTYPRGKQVLTLFQIDDLEIPSSHDFDETRKLYREYLRLKGKKQ